MARQPRNPPQFLGPWLGLNTTLDSSQLPDGYAPVARNVILSDARLRPRDGFVPVATVNRTPRAAVLKVLPVTLDPETFDARPGFLAYLNDGQLLRLETSGFGGAQLIRNLGEPIIRRVLPSPDPLPPPGVPPAAVRWGLDWILSTGDGLWLCNAEEAFLLAIPRPEQRQLNDPHPHGDLTAAPAVVGADPGEGINATVEYRITRYDRNRGRESNAWSSGSLAAGPDSAVRFAFRSDTQMVGEQALYRFTHWRIYRRNLSIANPFDGHRLIVEIPFRAPGSEQATYDDALAESEILLSTETDGPFAPTRNGLPPGQVHHMAAYQSRLFVAPAKPTGRLHYSEIGQPWAFAADATEEIIGDDDDWITGLAAAAEQLWIGKPGGAHRLSGRIITATNKTVAFGAVPEASQHVLHRTDAEVGPQTRYSNGLIRSQGGTFLVTADALLAFDGLSTRPVSDAIRPTWRAIMLGPAYGGTGANGPTNGLEVHHAEDPERAILYLGNPLTGRMLAYHYGINAGGSGAWTEIDLGRLVDPAVVTALTDEPFHHRPRPLPAGEGDVEQLQARRLVLGTGVVNDLEILVSDRFTDATTPIGDFDFRTGNRPLRRGRKVQVYRVKLFSTNPLASPGGDPPRVLVSVFIDGQLRAVRRVLISQETTAVIPVRAAGERFELRIYRDPFWERGFDSGWGVLGYEFDVELIGDA